LYRIKEKRNILLNTKKGKKSKYIGHIFCRNCFLKQVFEGEIKGRIDSDAKKRKKK